MAKQITSPVDKFPGSVTLYDPLTFPHVIAFQDAVNAVIDMGETTWSKLRYEILGGIIPCVESWDLEGIPEKPTADTFPATPLGASGELVEWLQEEITLLLTDAETVPNV